MKKITVFLCAAAAAFAQTQTADGGNLTIGEYSTPNYTIVKGDNLWDLSERHLGDPFLWGRIWDMNRYITDPYLIFPGDPLFIPGLGQAPQAVPVPVAVAAPLLVAQPAAHEQTALTPQPPIATPLIVEPTSSRIAMDRRALLDMFRYHISLEAQRQQPFVYEYARDKRGRSAAGKFSGAGAIRKYGSVITHSGRQLVMQHQNALVKIEIDKEEARNLIKVGERLGFYAIMREIENPKGVILAPVGSGLVRSLDGAHATVFADRLWGKLQEGAMLAPVREHVIIGDDLTYRTLSDSLFVRAVARLNAPSPVRPFETMFIDKGENDGVFIGDHIIFDGGLLEALVVAVGENSATVKITAVANLTSATLFDGVRAGRIVARDGGDL